MELEIKAYFLRKAEKLGQVDFVDAQLEDLVFQFKDKYKDHKN